MQKCPIYRRKMVISYVFALTL